MSAISFPLIADISSAANQVSSQNAEQLSAGGAGQSTGLRPDTVTLSAVFPPPPPVDAANFVQFQGPAQPALQAFPPAPAQTNGSPARPALASNATTAAPTPSQQEQLAQLDRVLERLGINPQSISLDNRLALIKSANDPPALLNLVRALGALNPAAASEQISALSANNFSNPAVTGNQTQAPAQNESQAQPQPASLPPLQSSSQPAGSGFGSTSSTPGTAASTADEAVLASNAAAQFQELQAVFQNAENAQNSSAAGSDASHKPALSIRV